MEQGYLLNRNENDITAGIGTDVLKLIRKTIESNSTESFYKIDGFCNKILMMSIENKYIFHFREYLDIVIGYYIISYEYNEKDEALYNEVFLACSDRSARRIKELFLLLNYVFNKSGLDDKKVYNRFKYLAFCAFSRLLLEQIRRKDRKTFKLTLEQLDNVFLGETIGMSEFEINLKHNQAELDNYREDIQANLYAKHVLMGIRYWLYFLYQKKQIDSQELDQFVRLTKQSGRNSMPVEFWEIELLFNKLNSIEFNGYFNWERWDYEAHPEGKVYSPPSAMEWFFSGFIIDAVQQGGIYNTSGFDVTVIEEKFKPQNKTLLIGTLKDKLDKVEKENIWITFFSNVDFQERIDRIREQLKSFSSSIEVQKAKEIASAALDEKKIEEFKQNFYNKWNNSKFIRRIFENFDEKKKYDGEKKLFLIGQNMFFEKAKMLFLDNDYYQHIYGVEDFGTRLSRQEDDFFFQTILKEQTEIVYPGVIKGLQNSIEKLRYRKNTPSAIFVDSTFYWNGLRGDEKWSDEKLLDFSNGSYDSIPVFFTCTGLMQNRFVVADFGKAFTMLYRTIKDGFDGELKLEIKEITDEIAKEKLNEEPQKWRNIDGQEISDEDALAYIKTSIIIDYEVVETFEVTDNNAFEVGLIENNIE